MSVKQQIEELEKELKELLESNPQPDKVLDLRLQINALRHIIDHPDPNKDVWQGYVQ